MITVGLVSLGCAKNLIDSEIMVGHLRDAGMAMTPDPELADVIIINTCTFIDTAKIESIDAIREALEAREEEGSDRRVIVAGCMSQRFSKELPRLMPKVDAFIGLDQITKVADIINELLGPETVKERNQVSRMPRYIPDYSTPRIRLTPDHFSYVKIAEGCNHPCSFCIIPQVRGRHRSRPIESVVREVERQVEEGVKEFNLISQDTTFFGMDRWQDSRPNPRSPVDSRKGESLAGLLKALDRIEGEFWIRMLYTHPAHWSDELIETMAECRKVARYVDMPLQHISDRMLDKMQRETSGEYIRDLIKRMRAKLPGLAIRTTFIVGFPGETEEDFGELMEFLRLTRFERVGVFKYSREEGTKAFKLAEQVHYRTKNRRWNTAMALQEEILEGIHRQRIGEIYEVLVDEPGIGRTQWDAPEIDGTVYLPEDLPVGDFSRVRMVEQRGYDLIAEAE